MSQYLTSLLPLEHQNIKMQEVEPVQPSLSEWKRQEYLIWRHDQAIDHRFHGLRKNEKLVLTFFRHYRLRDSIFQKHDFKCSNFSVAVIYSRHIHTFNIIQNVVIFVWNESHQYATKFDQMKPEHCCEFQEHNMSLVCDRSILLHGCSSLVQTDLNKSQGRNWPVWFIIVQEQLLWFLTQ